MRFLNTIGMTRTDEVEVKGVHVRPRDVLLKVVSEIPRPTDVVLDDVDYLLGVVRGLKDGRRVEWRVRATVPAHKEHGAGGGDVDTGIPPAIVARMLARGDIAGPGVFVPEQVVPCEAFFAEISRWASPSTRRCASCSPPGLSAASRVGRQPSSSCVCGGRRSTPSRCAMRRARLPQSS